MSLASRVNNQLGSVEGKSDGWRRACHSAMTNGTVLNRVPDQRKIELVQMVRLQKIIQHNRKQEVTFAQNFLTKQTTISKNVNQALHEIKSHEGEDAMKQRAVDIREDLLEGTANAKKKRQKVLKPEDRPVKEKLKPDMKTILATKPLIVRNKLQIPKYPAPFRDDLRSPTSNTYKKSDMMKPPSSAHSHYLSSAKSK